jgi:hypothetical protein
MNTLTFPLTGTGDGVVCFHCASGLHLWQHNTIFGNNMPSGFPSLCLFDMWKGCSSFENAKGQSWTRKQIQKLLACDVHWCKSCANKLTLNRVSLHMLIFSYSIPTNIFLHASTFVTFRYNISKKQRYMRKANTHEILEEEKDLWCPIKMAATISRWRRPVFAHCYMKFQLVTLIHSQIHSQKPKRNLP